MEDPVDNRAATMKKGPFYKTDARIARDYAANAVYDTKHGKKSEAKFEKTRREGGTLGRFSHYISVSLLLPV